MSAVIDPLFPSIPRDVALLQEHLCSWHESLKTKAFADLVLYVAISKPIPPIVRHYHIERDGLLIEREERVLSQRQRTTLEIPFAEHARTQGRMTKDLSLQNFKRSLAYDLNECFSFVADATRGYTITLTAFACLSETGALPTHRTWKVIRPTI